MKYKRIILCRCCIFTFSYILENKITTLDAEAFVTTITDFENKIVIQNIANCIFCILDDFLFISASLIIFYV